MNHIGSWFLIEHGEVMIWVDDRQTAHLVSALVNRPTSPRAQVLQLIEDLESEGFTRPQAIDHILKNPDHRSLLQLARERRSKNPTATKHTIYRWFREHNQ